MFCNRPFEQYYVDVDGDVHLCCPKWIAMPIGNVLSSNPVEIWNNWVATNIRKSIEDQSFRHCTNCRLLPGPSGCVVDEPYRLISTERIHTLTVAYDRTCNLACRSCRNEHHGPSEKAQRIQEMLISSGIFEKVDRLCVSGSGDPLASPLFWHLLYALPVDKYPHLRLVLQTNALLLNDARWKGLKHFGRDDKINEISVSVDAATEHTYRLNRGANFSVLLKNLESITERSIPLQLNFIVQQNNYDEMPAFVSLAKIHGAQKVYFSALDNWDTYDTSDYLRRAVHLPNHPEHGKLLEILRMPIFAERPFVTLAGLPTP